MPEGKNRPRSGPNGRAAEPLSLRAAQIQRLRRLMRDPRLRGKERAFVIEGPTLLGEALSAGARIDGVYATVGCEHPVLERARDAGIAVRCVAPGVVERVADAVTPQPVLAVAPVVNVSIEQVRDATMLVVCAGIADPGNLGTVLRVAEAAGADGVLCCAGSVDVYNPKTVRASAGSLFHIPVVVGGDPGEVLAELGTWGLHRLATRPHGDQLYDGADLTRRIAVVLGNEAHGLDHSLDGLLDEHVSIPMAGRTGSLNVAMAAAVIVFEAARQRRVA
jgi:TrmH family RNA methyltransferase